MNKNKQETLNDLYYEMLDKAEKSNNYKLISKNSYNNFVDILKEKANSIIQNKTLVVNLFAGPGAGKSTLASGIFYELKLRDISCELATEYAKDLVWENRAKAINNQIYIFGKQHHRINRLLGEVDVIVTDSPLLLTSVYNKSNNILNMLAYSEHKKHLSFNCFITRSKPYHEIGRLQTEKEAISIDNEIRNMLNSYMIEYISYFGNNDGKERIVDQILKILNVINPKYDGKT